MAASYPKWLPLRVKIISYFNEGEGSLNPSNILTQLQARYGGNYSETTSSLEVESGSTHHYVKAIMNWGTLSLLVAVGSSITSDNHRFEYSPDEHSALIKGLMELIPSNPDYSITLTMNYSSSGDGHKKSLQSHSKESGLTLTSVGNIEGCLLAAFDGGGSSPASDRDYQVFIDVKDREVVPSSAWDLALKACKLVAIQGNIRHLTLERQPMLSQIDASESATQMWINEVLARMRRPIDEIKPNDLEELLKEITIQFSRLSTLTNSMRRDNVKAGALIRSAKRLLIGWNERPLGELPTNSSVELGEMEDAVAPLGDFIERTEALTAQFDTVLDSVRTYLGIQQEKLSLSEQSSSREQLVQLVSLQETLHKLEVLVVAFYLTEMARVVFETVTVSAGLLTTLFIPVALLVSVLINRFLAKK